MRFLSEREAAVVAAIGAGLIPHGGADFEAGAADLADKWLPITDEMVYKMPFVLGLGLKVLLRGFNYMWPVIFAGRFKPMTSMNETELRTMLGHMEKLPFPVTSLLLLSKILVFIAFYELDEVKEAIGYQTRFPNHPDFEGLKD